MKDIELIHGDSLQALKGYGDNYFDLAIVDPPYGLGFDGEMASMTMSPNMGSERKKRWNGKKINQYTKKDWDKEVPSKEYWDELFRVSKNQIVWGGNHFELPQSRGWIFWDKKMDKGFSLADGELAWTSFDKGVKKFEYLWAGFKKKKPIKRIHPTQKPVKLYEWILMNYAKKNDKILDTHLGSGSIALACHNLGFDLTGCELDKEYYNAAMKRINQHRQQIRMFV